MSDYKIERDDFDEYNNGLCFHKQSSHSNTLMVKAHIHNCIEITYIEKGNFEFYINDIKYQLFAGDCVLTRSNSIHYTISGNASEHSYYFLKIKASELKNFTVPDFEDKYTMCFTIDSPNSKRVWRKEEIESSFPQIKNGFEMLINDYHNKSENSEIQRKIAVELILYDIFNSAGVTENPVSSGIAKDTMSAICKAMLYINKNYTEDITCEDMCKMVNLSYSYFSRTFKEITGNTFKEYLNVCRINYAESLLVNTNKSAVEICMESGFNNPAYFSKVYKEIKGVSPLASRKSKR